jgi:hypothetical protein
MKRLGEITTPLAFEAAARAVTRAHAAYQLAAMAVGPESPEAAQEWKRFRRMVDVWKDEGGMRHG